MASRKSDVQISIRAREEGASAALARVRDALQGILSAQEDAAREAREFTAAMAESRTGARDLGNTLQDSLTSKLAATAQGFDAIEQEIRQTDAAIAEMQARISRDTGVFQGLLQQRASAEIAIRRLRELAAGGDEGATAQIAEMEKALKAVGREIDKYGTRIQEGAAALTALTHVFDRLQQQAGAAQFAIAGIGEEQRRVNEAIEAQLGRTTGRYTELISAILRARPNLESLVDAQTRVAMRAGEAAAEAERQARAIRAAAEAARATAGIETTAAGLRKIAQREDELRRAAEMRSESERRMAESQRALADALRGTSAALGQNTADQAAAIGILNRAADATERLQFKTRDLAVQRALAAAQARALTDEVARRPNPLLDPATFVRARKEMGLTQARLAELLGYEGKFAQRNISRFERSDRKVPRAAADGLAEIYRSQFGDDAFDNLSRVQRETAVAATQQDRLRAALDRARAAASSAAQEQGDLATEIRRSAEATRDADIAQRRLEVARLRAQRAAEGAATGIARLAQAERDLAARMEKAARNRSRLAAANEEARVGTERLLSAEVRLQQALRDRPSRPAEVGDDYQNAIDAATRLGVRERDLARAVQKGAIERAAAEEATLRSILGTTRGVSNLALAQQYLAAQFRQTGRASKDAAASVGLTEQALRGLATQSSAMTTQVRNLRDAFKVFYGDSRQALSFFQRLRGELLGAVAGVVGLYAAVRQGREVFEAFTRLESAARKMSAALSETGGDVGAELAFVRGEAQRLGVEYAALADAYAKFVVSAQAGGFELDASRKIFRQFAEAGRILNLSVEDMNGVLTALSQIAGKGVVQMEELRQQLGDRLPGAVPLMARGLGYATDEMDAFFKAVTEGQVSAIDGLTALADQLEISYGSELPSALTSAKAEIGRFQDNIFQGRIVAGNAGFVDEVVEAVRRLNSALGSREGIEFFERLGAAAGRIVAGIMGLAETMYALRDVFLLLLAVKVAQFFGVLYSRIAASTAVTKEMGAATAITTASLHRMGLTTAVLSGRLAFLVPVMRNVIAASRALFFALGGIPGIIASLISYGLVSLFIGWFTAIDQANVALEEHRRLMDRVEHAYGLAKTRAEGWREALESLTKVDLQQNLDQIEKALDARRTDAAAQSRSVGGLFGGETGLSATLELLRTRADRLTADQKRAVDDLRDAALNFYSGGMTSDAYVAAIDARAETLREIPGLGTGDFAAEIERARGVGELADAADLARARLRQLTGDLTDYDRKVLGLGEGTDRFGDDWASAFTDINDAMGELRDEIPALAGEMERLESEAKIHESFERAVRAAVQLNDEVEKTIALDAARDARDAARLSAAGVAATPGLLSFLRREEGTRLQAYQDNGGTLTIGTGHTNNAGGFQFDEDAVITREQAEQILREDLARFLARFDEAVRVPVTDAMRTALVSYDFNTGRLVGSEIVRLLNEGNYAGAQEALRNGINTIDGEVSAGLTRRRAREADLFGSQGLDSVEISAEAGRRAARLAADEAQTDERRREAAREFDEQHAARIEQAEFELSLADKELIARETALALRRAEQEATRAGTELTAQQRAEIERITAEKFRQQAIDERRNQLLEEAAAVQQKVTDLEVQAGLIQAQRDAAAESGNTEAARSFAAQLVEVNSQLETAVQRSLEFWRAVGGPEAVAAIAQLERLRIDLAKSGEQALLTGAEVDNLFANQLSNGMSQFLEALASGKASLKDFGAAFRQTVAQILIQLGQIIVVRTILAGLSGIGFGGAVAGAVGTVAHTGGVIGATALPTRRVHPAVFANAIRYHGGGVAGLGGNEVAAILERGEEVLTADDPRHALNGGRQGAAPTVHIVNTFDMNEALEAASATPAGDRAILNMVNRNSKALRGILTEG